MQKLMIIMSALVIFGCAHAEPTAKSPENFNIESIGEGIYVHHGAHLDIDEGYKGDICNASFIVGSKGVAVVDTGGSLKVGQKLREAIRKVTPLPVLYVINTHVHPDHVYGNAAFLGDKPQFVGHEKLANAMQTREEQYTKLNARLLGEDAKGSDLVKPTVGVKNTLTLDLGDRKLVLTAHPVAHTNTDLSLIESKANTLFTGDLLFIERTPVVETDIKGLIAELEKFKTAEVKQVVPGHGPVTKNWLGAIGDAQRYLNALLNDIRASIKKGESMESAMSSAAASEKDKWVLFEVANRRNVNTIYPALEWE
ncbi:MAG TPA: quinoprotein relay system zinc metallohydrolase 2 [Methylotenera sp.]|nr:quinoprotein relay system zinc metallohydrolase 2 [Methylotenera sp.]HPH04651.1 quinoprotein relay system zinc metallohydrolase 2 [Methylotenera sp.]HPN01665.1 quinoprotein relay system zinc metallohydrolase 2 [Methylotenera sp.]